jgi:hypothetical protein
MYSDSTTAANAATHASRQPGVSSWANVVRGPHPHTGGRGWPVLVEGQDLADLVKTDRYLATFEVDTDPASR